MQYTDLYRELEQLDRLWPGSSRMLSNDQSRQPSRWRWKTHQQQPLQLQWGLRLLEVQDEMHKEYLYLWVHSPVSNSPSEHKGLLLMTSGFSAPVWPLLLSC